MGHGTNNSTLINKQSEADERALIAHVVGTIEKATGARPRGWLSPALSESHRTLDILAENKIEYVANWVNDEQPYPMRVKTGTMLSMPYSLEINDIPVFLDHHQSGETFGRMIRDQFDGLYEDGAKTGPRDGHLGASVPDRASAPQQVFRKCARPHHFAAGSVACHGKRNRGLVQEKLFGHEVKLQTRTGFSSTGFSLWVLVLAGTNPHRLKPVLLKLPYSSAPEDAAAGSSIVYFVRCRSRCCASASSIRRSSNWR